jgi:hypothetical protein
MVAAQRPHSQVWDYGRVARRGRAEGPRRFENRVPKQTGSYRTAPETWNHHCAMSALGRSRRSRQVRSAPKEDSLRDQKGRLEQVTRQISSRGRKPKYSALVGNQVRIRGGLRSQAERACAFTGVPLPSSQLTTTSLQIAGPLRSIPPRSACVTLMRPSISLLTSGSRTSGS